MCVTYTLLEFHLTAWVGAVRTGLSRKLALWSNRLGSGPVRSLGRPIGLPSILFYKALIIALVSTWSSAILLRQRYWSCFLWSP